MAFTFVDQSGYLAYVEEHCQDDILNQGNDVWSVGTSCWNYHQYVTEKILAIAQPPRYLKVPRWIPDGNLQGGILTGSSQEKIYYSLPDQYLDFERNISSGGYFSVITEGPEEHYFYLYVDKNNNQVTIADSYGGVRLGQHFTTDFLPWLAIFQQAMNGDVESYKKYCRSSQLFIDRPLITAAWVQKYELILPVS